MTTREQGHGRTLTGIYGGSFNPIHLGHTRLGRALCDMGLVDELWFMVSPQNPLKAGNASLLADDVRLHLARLAVEQTPRLRVSDFEFSLPRPSYMVRTLELLSEAHCDREFVLVIGADNWQRFPRWHRHNDILARHRVIVYPRPGYPLPPQLPPGVTLARTPLIPYSSTDIRDRIRQGTFNGEGLHPAVWKEIQTKGLYT